MNRSIADSRSPLHFARCLPGLTGFSSSSSERCWLIPAALLVGGEFLAAFVLSAVTGYPGRPRVGFHVIGLLGLGLVSLFAIFLFALFRLMLAGADRPAHRLATGAWELRWRIVSALAGLQILAGHFIAYNWAKAMIPWAIPFWLDPPLARLDMLIFGEAAWSWALQVVGPLSAPIRWVYSLWLPIQLLAIAAVIAVKPSRTKALLILAYFCTWIIGGALSFPLSSAGPLFYQPLGFGDDFLALKSSPHMGGVSGLADYLWQNYQDSEARVGVGISAMPSLHVAIAAWMVLAARKLDRLKWLAFAFFASIFVGSFLLGWHYFADAPAGIFCTWLGLVATKRLCDRRRDHRPPSVAETGEAAGGWRTIVELVIERPSLGRGR